MRPAQLRPPAVSFLSVNLLIVSDVRCFVDFYFVPEIHETTNQSSYYFTLEFIEFRTYLTYLYHERVCQIFSIIGHVLVCLYD
jgi:hypothetical protein